MTLKTNSVACIGLVCYGLEEAQQNTSVSRCSSRHLYLTCSNHLPDPCMNTPWQVLYHSQSDRGSQQHKRKVKRHKSWPAYIRQLQLDGISALRSHKCWALKM